MYMGLSTDGLKNRSCGLKMTTQLHFPSSDGSYCSHLSFQGFRYWGHIQLLVNPLRFIILNNCPLRQSTQDLSSRCWPTKDHPMLMPAPGSYYRPLADTSILTDSHERPHTNTILNCLFMWILWYNIMLCDMVSNNVKMNSNEMIHITIFCVVASHETESHAIWYIIYIYMKTITDEVIAAHHLICSIA